MTNKDLEILIDKTIKYIDSESFKTPGLKDALKFIASQYDYYLGKGYGKFVMESYIHLMHNNPSDANIIGKIIKIAESSKFSSDRQAQPMQQVNYDHDYDADHEYDKDGNCLTCYGPSNGFSGGNMEQIKRSVTSGTVKQLKQNEDIIKQIYSLTSISAVNKHFLGLAKGDNVIAKTSMIAHIEMLGIEVPQGDEPKDMKLHEIGKIIFSSIKKAQNA